MCCSSLTVHLLASRTLRLSCQFDSEIVLRAAQFGTRAAVILAEGPTAGGSQGSRTDLNTRFCERTERSGGSPRAHASTLLRSDAQVRGGSYQHDCPVGSKAYVRSGLQWGELSIERLECHGGAGRYPIHEDLNQSVHSAHHDVVRGPVVQRFAGAGEV